MAALSGRTAGIPNLVLVGAAAVAIWFLFLRGKAAGPAKAATSPSGQATTDYSLGYAQGVQSAGAQAPPAATAPAGPQITLAQQPSGQHAGVASNQGIPVYSLDPQHQGILGYLPFGSKVPYTSQTTGAAGDPGYVVPWGSGTGFISGLDVIGLGGPANGGRSRGSRAKAPEWHEAHPLIGAPVPYEHYVRAVGGPRAHRSEVHRVARQAGVHPARVQMLNPQHTGRIRIK